MSLAASFIFVSAALGQKYPSTFPRDASTKADESQAHEGQPASVLYPDVAQQPPRRVGIRHVLLEDDGLPGDEPGVRG